MITASHEESPSVAPRRRKADRRKRKLHKNIQIAFYRLARAGGLLCRQFSDSEEARISGGHYVYFTVRDNTKFPTASGRFLIEEGLVKSCADGLFADTPQTFRAVSKDEFERFKERYESM
ncbi:hypothetical protein GOL29_03235 [Sinorhizobium medicae]|nr:hypothetical protein [Sinorhizobium medicae]